jgi:hypothetical protein
MDWGRIRAIVVRRWWRLLGTSGRACDDDHCCGDENGGSQDVSDAIPLPATVQGPNFFTTPPASDQHLAVLAIQARQRGRG